MPYALLAAQSRIFAGLANGELWDCRDRGESWSRCTLRGDRLDSLLALATADA
jgi:photosystem II stability/assembly factor-like uncharacterized protein